MVSQTFVLVSLIGLLLPAGFASGRRLMDGMSNGSGCPKTHPLVGVEKELTTIFHEVSGTLKVVDDCTVDVTNFKYDGLGPAVFWYGASSKEGLEEPSAINFGELPEGESHNGTSLSLRLPGGASWDDSSVLSVWCVLFAIDFGSANLKD
ncbi:hypothetical protein BSKO_07205 [Bryopsis sp. KO-2023]|nr:hypothetical protein BSKO_07205 [Bryopsis sp. KO-2023]